MSGRYVWRKFGKLLTLVTSFALSAPTHAEEAGTVLLHPPFATEAMRCTEHYAGEFQELGDALGTDCLVAKVVTVNGRSWMQDYEGDGTRNEQWYSWRVPVLAPCRGIVSRIHINEKVNMPGVMGTPPASIIVVLCDSGVNVLLAHIQQPSVQIDDHVAEGQVIATVGNNGMSRSPHVHVGAWKGGSPLQVRWNQSQMVQ